MRMLISSTYLLVAKSYVSHVAVRPSSLTPPATTIFPLWITAPNMDLGVFMEPTSFHSDLLWLYANILLVALLYRGEKPDSRGGLR